jgi:hypothetical protein
MIEPKDVKNGEVFDWIEVASLAVKAVGKPAVYVANHVDWDEEEDSGVEIFLLNLVDSTYNDPEEVKLRNELRLLVSTGGLVFFDTKEEQYRFYKLFEEGVVESSCVYACTVDETGKCLTENT